MRISIWQQFSSNHSADFIIVGTFESELAAQQSAEMLRSILRRVARYWQELPEDEAWKQWDRVDEEMTPVEREMSQELGVEWSKDAGHEQPHGIDWLPWNPDKAATAVTVFDNHVFVESMGNTWGNAEPFETLLRRNATSVAGNYYIKPNTNERWEGSIKVTVSCRAPDQKVLQGVLDNMKIWATPPRKPGERYSPAILIKLEDYIQGDFEREPDISIGGLIHLSFGSVEIQGLQMQFTEDTWEPRETAESLVNYLKAQGFYDIHYKFSQAD